VAAAMDRAVAPAGHLERLTVRVGRGAVLQTARALGANRTCKWLLGATISASMTHKRRWPSHAGANGGCKIAPILLTAPREFGILQSDPLVGHGTKCTSIN
jgi:hypothetical protein